MEQKAQQEPNTPIKDHETSTKQEQPIKNKEASVAITGATKEEANTASRKGLSETITPTEARLEVSVEKAPEIIVSTGTDWVAFLGFAITAFIVLLTTRQTIKNSSALIISQETLTLNSIENNRAVIKAELTANNRQAWINTLRTDISNYIASISAIWDLHQIKAGRSQILREHGTVENNLKELFEWSLVYHKGIQDAEGLLAKIKLLLNPAEEKSKKLIALLDGALNNARDNKLPSHICSEIISASQPILKEEWERVKSMS